MVDDCFTEMLSHWLEHSTPEYTKLVEALTSPAIARMDIAERVGRPTSASITKALTSPAIAREDVAEKVKRSSGANRTKVGMLYMGVCILYNNCRHYQSITESTHTSIHTHYRDTTAQQSENYMTLVAHPSLLLVPL